MSSADLVYGAHDGDGAFGMTGEQLLEGGIEMTNIRLFRFLLMSKPHSPNGALAQYRWGILNIFGANTNIFNGRLNIFPRQVPHDGRGEHGRDELRPAGQ